MRQIEDRWRINIRDPPNPNETLLKIINDFKYTSTQIKDVHNYRDSKFQNYILNKCSQICFKRNSFNDCMTNCAENLTLSNKRFENSLDEFEEKYSAYEISGKDYFKS
jgi:hypothetical protein